MGGPLGFIDGGDTMGLMRAVHQIFYTQAAVGYMPGQMKCLQWRSVQLIASLLGKADGFRVFSEWSRRQIKSRMDEGPHKDPDRPRDLLDHFISMKEPDGRDATAPSVGAEVGNLIGAGADTAAVGMAVVMAQLVEHPEDQTRLRQEVDEAYEKAGLSGQDSAQFSLRELERLPFLNACVQEATRLCPSIVWQLPREAPEAGITIAGHYIPPGATLGMSPMAHNRSKEIFGDDADEWRPQRWLPAGEQVEGKATKSERQKRMDKYNVTVSGACTLNQFPTPLPLISPCQVSECSRLISDDLVFSLDMDPGSASDDISLQWRWSNSWDSLFANSSLSL